MVWFRAGVMEERFGAGKCAYCDNPNLRLVRAERMDINGRKMPGHLHHDDGPDVFRDDHQIAGGDGSDVTGNYDYDAGGILAEADVRFIVAAVNYVRAALSQPPSTPREP